MVLPVLKLCLQDIEFRKKKPIRFFAVMRQMLKAPLLVRCPQKCINPRNVKVSGSLATPISISDGEPRCFPPLRAGAERFLTEFGVGILFHRLFEAQ
jgi:hypothetical protein